MSPSISFSVQSRPTWSTLVARSGARLEHEVRRMLRQIDAQADEEPRMHTPSAATLYREGFTETDYSPRRGLVSFVRKETGTVIAALFKPMMPFSLSAR